MKHKEIIAMAKEAGMNLSSAQFSGVLETETDEFTLASYAALVAAKEREACALVCDGFDTGRRLTSDFKAAEMAAAIRARGQKEGA